MLTRDIAEKIVTETMIRVNRNINIMDQSGRIVASGDHQRIGEVHVGAKMAIESGEIVRIYAHRLHEWPGAQPGINMPILFQGQTVGAIGITGDADQLLEVAQLVNMTAELMLRQSYLIAQQEWRNRLKESLLEEIMKPDRDEHKLKEQFKMLNIRFAEPYQAVLIRLGEAVGYHSLMLRKIEELYGVERVLVSLRDEHHIVVVTFHMDEQESDNRLQSVRHLLLQLGHEFYIGCSSMVRDSGIIRELIDEADFALRHTSTSGEIRMYTGLEPQWIIAQSDEDSKVRFAERLLQNIDSELQETLRMFFVCHQHLRKTAEALYVHQNTVLYRLQKIESLTGKNPRHFHDALAFQIALWCLNPVDATKKETSHS